jgi:hypothetical protein
MAADPDEVEAVLRQHWKIPGTSNQTVLQTLAFRIHVMVGQKYSHDNLKYQLHLMQTKDLHQQPDDSVCDRIASELLKPTRA